MIFFLEKPKKATYRQYGIMVGKRFYLKRKNVNEYVTFQLKDLVDLYDDGQCRLCEANSQMSRNGQSNLKASLNHLSTHIRPLIRTECEPGII